MKKAIEAHLPDNFTELLKSREAAKERMSMLMEKRAEAEQRLATMKSDLGKLDNELAEAVNQGADTGGAMRKIRTAKSAIEDHGRLLGLSIDAVQSAENSVTEANRALAGALQRAVIEGRNAVAERLQSKLAEIENSIHQWRSAVYGLSEELGLPSPAAGTEIILPGLE